MSQKKRVSFTDSSCKAGLTNNSVQSTEACHQQKTDDQPSGDAAPFWRKSLKRLLSKTTKQRSDSSITNKLDDAMTESGGPRNMSEAKIAMVYSLTKHQKLEEISDIVERFPGCLEAVNCFGQTPLHVAAQRGAQPDVIAYICLKHPSACSIQDETGKLPLHYVVTQSKRFFQDVEIFNPWCEEVLEANKKQSTERCIQVYLEMLRIVVKAYPQALDTEDEDETNPIENAILHDAPYRVVCTLQQFSRKMWKEHEAKQRQITSQMA